MVLREHVPRQKSLLPVSQSYSTLGITGYITLLKYLLLLVCLATLREGDTHLREITREVYGHGNDRIARFAPFRLEIDSIATVQKERTLAHRIDPEFIAHGGIGGDVEIAYGDDAVTDSDEATTKIACVSTQTLDLMSVEDDACLVFSEDVVVKPCLGIFADGLVMGGSRGGHNNGEMGTVY